MTISPILSRKITFAALVGAAMVVVEIGRIGRRMAIKNIKSIKRLGACGAGGSCGGVMWYNMRKEKAIC